MHSFPWLRFIPISPMEDTFEGTSGVILLLVVLVVLLFVVAVGIGGGKPNGTEPVN